MNQVITFDICLFILCVGVPMEVLMKSTSMEAIESRLGLLLNYGISIFHYITILSISKVHLDMYLLILTVNPIKRLPYFLEICIPIQQLKVSWTSSVHLDPSCLLTSSTEVTVSMPLLSTAIPSKNVVLFFKKSSSS